MKKLLEITLCFVIFLFSATASQSEIQPVYLANITKTSGVQEKFLSWSPDGSKVLYSKGCDYTAGGSGLGLYIANEDLTNQVELIPPQISYNIGYPAWSPDGSKIAYCQDFVGGGNIWVIDVNTKKRTQITFDTGMENFPQWSPDGSKIVFSKGDYYGNKRNIWIMNSDGSNQMPLTLGDNGDSFPSWSPDGTKIIFTRVVNNTGYTQIFIMNCDGTDVHPLTDDAGHKYRPIWSPDGKYITYFSGSGPSTWGGEIWVMNADGTGKTRLTNLGDSFCPTWNPSGTIIAFHKEQGGCNADIYFAYLSSGFSLSWAKTYNVGNIDRMLSIQQTADGGYAMLGRINPDNGYTWLAKLNELGDIQWQKKYSGTGDTGGYGFQQTSDGGFIITGHREWSKAWVAKLNATGGIEWQKTFSRNYFNWITSVQQTSEGGYILLGPVGGWSDGASGYDIWVAKIDQVGNVIWQKTYSSISTTPWNDYATTIQQTKDGGYILCSSIYSTTTGYDALVLKLDSLGNIEWKKAYGGSSNDHFHSYYGKLIHQTYDGGYILGGTTYSFGAGNRDAWVLKLDHNGIIQWEKAYGGVGNDYLMSIRQTADGGYIVVGNTDSFGAGGGDIWIFKLDFEGNIQWQKTYGGTGEELGYDVRQTIDGGYVVISETRSFGGGWSDALILKLDSNGNLGGCSSLSMGISNAIINNTNAIVYNPEISLIDINLTSQPTNVNISETNVIPYQLCQVIIEPVNFPDISIAPNLIEFGNVNVGATLDKQVIIKNDGNANLVIGTITSPSSPFSKLSDNCSGKTIAPNNTCTITYRFSPTSGGLFSSYSNLLSNDPNENPVTIILNGTGCLTLSGRVTDSQTGESLKNALVNIQNKNFSMSDYTDANGDYFIELIPPGVYTLTASYPGSNYGQYQELLNITANTTKNISLSPFIYEIIISTIYNGTNQTLQIQAIAYNLTNGSNVTNGTATYTIYEEGAQLRSGSLTYSAASAHWISDPISFPFFGTYTALLTINGNTKKTNFSTNSNLVTIKGKVKDLSGNIISDAEVMLFSALDQSTPIQSVTSSSSGYYFNPVVSGYYLVKAVKGIANGKSETFYTSSNIIEKDITIEANELIAKYSGQIDELSNGLMNLIDKEPLLLNEMSKWIDFEMSNFNLWDIVEKTWSFINMVHGVVKIPEIFRDITKLINDTQYFTDKTKAIGTICGIIEMLGSVYKAYNFEKGLYSDFDRYFNHPDENGIPWGPAGMAWAGEGNHYLSLDYLKSNSTPYSASITNLNIYKSNLKNYLSTATPDNYLDLNQVSRYLQERNDLLKWSLSNDNNRSQTILYLPETKYYVMSTLKPIFLRYMKDVDSLHKLMASKFITKGVSTASWFLTGPVGFALSTGATVLNPIISHMEERVEGDLLNQWILSRKEYEKDLIDYPNYLNSIYGFLQNEFSNPYYLRAGNMFSGRISNVNVEFSSIPIIGGIINIPDTSQINVSSTITNTGNPSRLSLFSENYAFTLFSTIFKWITMPFTLLWDREPPQIGVLSDIKYSIYEDVPNNTSYEQTHTLLTNTNFLSQLLDLQKVHLKLYSGPWKVDEHIHTYNLLSQTSSAHPELKQNLLGGVRTFQKALTLQDAVDLVTREKERHSITLDLGGPIYEQDIMVSSDVSKLHLYFYHGEGDADLHLYDGFYHVGFNYDKSANDIEFPASYTGSQSNPEIITIPDAAGKTFHIKINLTQPSGQGNVIGTLIIMEEPLRPAIMATSPLNIEIDASPGQKDLAISIRVAESSHQNPLYNLNATISSLTNAYGQSLTLTSSSTYSNSVLSGGGEETITFTFDIPNDSTGIYTGTIAISSDNAGEIIKNVTIRVDSDKDGLPDYWEKIYGFNPEQPGEADLDTDGDGYTNFQEYQFGTDPLDSLDYPHIHCEGDFDYDGDVDGVDLATFASEYGRTNCNSSTPCKSDFDNDGDVDEDDLAVFANNFGKMNW